MGTRPEIAVDEAINPLTRAKRGSIERGLRVFMRRPGVWWRYSQANPTYLRGSEEGMAETYKGEAYCVKCKEKRQFEGTVNVSDSGRRMAKGKCPTCGTTVNRILGKA